MAKKKAVKKASQKKRTEKVSATQNKPSIAIAIVALLVNILLIPGVGSIIGGKTKAGIWQLVLLVVGIIFSVTIIGLVVGIPLLVGAWIWALITGIQLIQKSNQ